MNTFKKAAMILVFLIFSTFPAFGQDSSERGGRQRHQGPPPKAYTACEGKSAGDNAEFTDLRGETVTGICEAEGDQLVLRPDNPPPRRSGKDRNRENTDN